MIRLLKKLFRSGSLRDEKSIPDGLRREMEQWELHFKVQEGNLRAVKELVAQGRPLDAYDASDRTPLHYAADGDHLNIAKLLLKAGADVNAIKESNSGDTPLAFAVAASSFDMVKLLIDHGANPNIPGWKDMTAFDRLRSRNLPDVPEIQRLFSSTTNDE